MGRWIDKRFPISTLKKWILQEEIPGGARFAYSLGSAALFLFILLALTGIWQMFVYVPTVDHAYDSLSYLRLDVPFGWLIHGIHYWGGTAFAVVVGLHMIRVFFWGAYKKPRELIWLAGIVLLILTALFMFTGPILPWDKKGYWACKVGSSIIGSIPWVGSFLQALLQGGQQIGQLTLTRIFSLHVAILPSLLILFVVIHLVSFRMFGSIGPWKKEKRRIKGQFWPDQIFKDMVVAFLIFILLVGLTVYFPPPFSGAADPLDTTYIPRPEWTFAFVFQLLKYFPGKLESVGIVGIPLFIILFFISLPFIDRSPEQNPFKRLFVISCGTLFILFILFFTILGIFSSPPSEVASHSVQKITGPEESPLKSPVIGLNPSQKKGGSEGERLFFANACNVCHTMTGKPTHKMGPDLVLALSQRKGLTKEWLYTQLSSPKTHNPNSLMPSYDHLKPEEINALVTFLELLSTLSPEEAEKKYGEEQRPEKQQPISESKELTYGKSIDIIGNSANGKNLYDLYCLQCHGPNGNTTADHFQNLSGVPSINPINRSIFNEDINKFLQNIDIFIQYGASNKDNGPNMPAFGATHVLTQEQIADIEAYVLQINGVDRTKIENPGIDPKKFFFILIGISAGLVILSYFYYKSGRK